MYEEILNNYISNIEALRTYVSCVEPILISNGEESLKCDKNVLLFIVSNLAKSLKEDDTIKGSFGENIEKLIQENEEKLNDASELRKSIKTRKVISFMDSLLVYGKQFDVLFQGSLISLIVYFELLISKLLTLHIKKYPKILNSKTLSLEEIYQFGSIDDAQKYLIDKEVEDIMRGSFNKWYKFLSETVKLPLECININKDLMVEIFQRRNLIVHNDGIVNSIYLKNVSDELILNLKKGDKISVEKNYLINSIDLLEKVGIQILLNYWLKGEKNGIKRIQILIDIAYELLLKEKWESCIVFYEHLLDEEQISSSDRIICKINYWLCMKSIGNIEVVMSEIEKTDLSATRQYFLLGVYALKDDYDEFFKLLDKLYPHEIDIDSIKEWPILNNIRETDMYNDFLISIGKEDILDLVAINEEE